MSKKKNFGLIILVIPFLILIPFLGDFFYQPGSLYSDLTVSHLPNAYFLHQTLFAGKGVPFWSPTILSGYPFAADPLSGLWYPPGWMAVLFPTPLVYNLLFILHLILDGTGTFLFLKAQKLKIPAALFGGLLFESLPILFAHFAAGHITLVYAVSWTPWLLLAEFTVKKNRFRNWSWALPGIVLGIISLADIRWSVFAGILWLGYGLFARKDIEFIRN